MNLYMIGQENSWFEFYKAETYKEALKLADCAEGEVYFFRLVEENTQEIEINPDCIKTCQRLGFEIIDKEESK